MPILWAISTKRRTQSWKNPNADLKFIHYIARLPLHISFLRTPLCSILDILQITYAYYCSYNMMRSMIYAVIKINEKNNNYSKQAMLMVLWWDGFLDHQLNVSWNILVIISNMYLWRMNKPLLYYYLMAIMISFPNPNFDFHFIFSSHLHLLFVLDSQKKLDFDTSKWKDCIVSCYLWFSIARLVSMRRISF